MPFAQRTVRQAKVLQAICGALTSRGGRAARQLQLTGSPSTLLRLIQQWKPPRRDAPRIVGVDDFAFRRGQTYGTVIVDLETHQPIDLLPDRTQAVLETWLTQHPNIAVVSRDRSTEYAAALRQALPKSIQVLDRWHLLKNLWDVLEPFLGRHQRVLRDHTLSTKPRTHADQAKRQEAVAYQLTFLSEVQRLRSEGQSIRSIARHLGCSRWLAKRYVRADAIPERRRSSRRQGLIDPYLPYLHERWSKGCRNAMLLFREIKSQGYPGGHQLVCRWAHQLRREIHPSTRIDYRAALQTRQHEILAVAHDVTLNVSPRDVLWLIWQDATRLREEEQLALNTLTEHLPQVATLLPLVSTFRAFLRLKPPEQVTPWLQAAMTSGIADLQRFAKSLQCDQPALEAAATLPWSQGPVEGVVNKIKLIKRQMYGRAGFHTLRSRVLFAFEHQA